MLLTKEYFEREYVEKGRTSVEIAAEVGLAPNTIRARMRKLGVPVQSVKGFRMRERADVAEDTLRELYVVQRKTVREVAAEVGFSASYVTRALRACGLNDFGRTRAGKPSPMRGCKRDPKVVRKIQETKRRRHSSSGPTPKPVSTRFWSKVAKTAECWLWQGGKNNYGYGQLFVGDRKRLAHRISWELHFGSIPHGQNVLHRCDNSACVRPEHLFLGSMQVNSRDMTKKGRWRNQYTTRLSRDDIVKLRKLYASGVTQVVLAATFNIHQGTVSRVVRKEAHRE